VFRSVLTFGQLLEIVLQVAQGVGDSWGGCLQGATSLLEWSDQRARVCEQRATGG